MITTHLANHVFNIITHKNRGIYIDMAFKGKVKYRIINIYSPANQSSQKEKIDLINWSAKAISESENKSFSQ